MSRQRELYTQNPGAGVWLDPGGSRGGGSEVSSFVL